MVFLVTHEVMSLGLSGLPWLEWAGPLRPLRRFPGVNMLGLAGLAVLFVGVWKLSGWTYGPLASRPRPLALRLLLLEVALSLGGLLCFSPKGGNWGWGVLLWTTTFVGGGIVLWLSVVHLVNLYRLLQLPRLAAGATRWRWMGVSLLALGFFECANYWPMYKFIPCADSVLDRYWDAYVGVTEVAILLAQIALVMLVVSSLVMWSRVLRIVSHAIDAAQ